MDDDRLIIAGHVFESRLWVGTGKYKDFPETKRAIDAAGTMVVTGAVRRFLSHRRVDPRGIDFKVMTPVSVRFDEPMDGTSISAGVLVVCAGADQGNLVLDASGLVARTAPRQ